MQRDLIVKSRSLGGSSDLTLLATIQPGLVDSLDSVTYKTRIKRVLETLHGLRQNAYEHATARLISDAIERVGAIQSVRVAVLELEPQAKVLLAVTFDGSWESYIRVLWDKVGTLLDLIFCGTVDYVSAYDHSFEEWKVWATRVQVETGFFYAPPDFTARDALYQRRLERMRQRDEGGDLNELRTVAPSAEMAVERLLSLDSALGDPPYVWIEPPKPQATLIREQYRNGLRGLAALYQLTDMHRPGSREGETLWRATIDLLMEFIGLIGSKPATSYAASEAYARFPRQVKWLLPGYPDVKVPVLAKRPAPQLPEQDEISPNVLHDVQGGIVRQYNGTTLGVIVMLSMPDAHAAKQLLAWIESHITVGSDDHTAARDTVYRNFALTPAGLRAVGLGEDALALFPEEFRQGMAARAGLLGDVRNNHPGRWRLPKPPGQPEAGPTPWKDRPSPEGVSLDSVHAVLQLRCFGEIDAPTYLEDSGHPLQVELKALREQCPLVQVLSVQSLRRRRNNATPPAVVEHFGYADGSGQPDIEKGEVPDDYNRIFLGEVVCGHDNAADFAAEAQCPHLESLAAQRQAWLKNGSFLVMRKYRQFAHRLELAVKKTACNMTAKLKGSPTKYQEDVYAKLMGRRRDGTPLVPGNGLNAFDYSEDPQGTLCPLHAHIRLAHPRAEKSTAARLPRLMRRSMAYGPVHTPNTDDDDVDRGLVFMTYNASIGEQFEVVQRWLAGGNSTGSSSGQSCPILGVPDNGVPRHFRFEYPDKNNKAHTFNVRLEHQTPLFYEPETLTRLEWGMYLFAPSIAVLRKLHEAAARAAASSPGSVAPWEASRGRALIAKLQRIESESARAIAVEAWKAVIEDTESIDRLDSASLWAAIRADHGGVLRTPYGTLVASRELLTEVLLDPHERYSVCGQRQRMKLSFGDIFLGMDPSPEYREQSQAVNDAIKNLTDTASHTEAVFQIAFKAANTKLDSIINQAIAQSTDVNDAHFEVAFNARELTDEVLADLCEVWFGIDGGKDSDFQRGGQDWAWQAGDKPIYPGQFTSLSRYMFQPHPGDTPIALGQQYGSAMRSAMNKFVARYRPTDGTKSPLKMTAPIALAAFKEWPDTKQNDLVARTLVGVLMGFNPTIIGAVLNVLKEWHRDGSFGGLRGQGAGISTYRQARELIHPSMARAARMRPMPQITWRTAVKAHRLAAHGVNGVLVDAGDIVIVPLVAGTQQSLEDGQYDERLMFGGNRDTAPHPTHACPGYEAGIAAMLGTLAALVARPEAIRQGGVAHVFMAEGAVMAVPPGQQNMQGAATDADLFASVSLSSETLAATAKPIPPLPKLTPAQKSLVLAFGDSWLAYSYSILDFGNDLRDQLEKIGYTIPDNYCDWQKYGTMDLMAQKASAFCDWITTKIQNTPAAQPARAVLLSGGGNDSTELAFRNLLNTKGTIAQIVDPVKLQQHVADLERNYTRVLDAVIAKQHGMKKANPAKFLFIPILIHGYDYALARASASSAPAKWFVQPYQEAEYFPPADQKAMDDGVQHVIIAFNTMLKDLANSPTYSPYVRYVKLTGTISNYWTADRGAAGWANDLHPTNDAFRLLTLKIHEAIEEVRLHYQQPVWP